ncbi:MAG: response regulator [Betaproteobacteria bacterium]
MARIGKYVVTGELGRGSRAAVSSALDPGIGRPVAIKRLEKAALPPERSRALVERFRRQAQAAGQLHHPNIIAIYEYEEDAAAAWIAMEIVHGKTLREHLAAGYRPAPGEVPELVASLLEALDFAHGAGVVHGAVSAENLLVGANGAPKLGNFGERPADEAGDVRAAAALVREVLGDQTLFQPVLEKEHPSPRALLDALRASVKPKGVNANVNALRRAIGSPAAAKVPARRLPAVLFVDDEERVLNALAALFDGVYDVATVTSGAAALELLKARRFLVVVSDQRMPGMTGVELLREMRGIAPGTVRLLLTGYSDLSAVIGSVNESEVFRFVSKPWDRDELRATLAEAVSVAIALEAAEASGRRAAKSDAPVLVIGEPAAARGVRELAGGAYAVEEAADPEAALEELARRAAGVVVCDLLGDADPAALLRVLKRESPNTQLIVVSATSDADLTIGLINEARIFRLLAKPVNLSLLHQAVLAALERHARLAAAPGLARTQAPKEAAETPRSRSLLARIRTLSKALGA